MRMLMLGVVSGFLAASGAWGSALDGRELSVRIGTVPPEGAVITIADAGAAPEGRVTVESADGATVFPATVRDGNLTFVASGLAADETHALVARVHEEAGEPNVRVILDEEAGTAEVHVRGAHFTTYQFHEEARIPHLWPVHAEGDVTITRNFPMGEDEPVASTDHRHHVSLWTAFGDVNGADTWHRSPIVVEKITVGSGDAYGWIVSENVWNRHRRGGPIVQEIREYRFYDGPPSARMIDQSVTFRADHGEVTFGDDKEGFFAFRIRPEIQGNRNGVLTNALGQQGERAVYGTPTAWMDYSGPVEGAGNRGVALFSHPENLRLPAWHVRDYGLAGCNFFAMQDVAKLEEDGSHTLAEGETLTLRARYFIHSGDVEEAAVGARYVEYAEPPAAAWTE